MMNNRLISSLLFMVIAAATSGCMGAPGKPGAGPEVPRPERVVDFATLYAQNCAACHGAAGKNGAAISLANPVYLAVAGATNIQHATSTGVPATAMPAFAGHLTDQQIAVLAQGMIKNWGNPPMVKGQALPAYSSSAPGDAGRGQQAFGIFCARCHGADGSGVVAGNTHTGSLIDPAYLALVSNQGLRSLIIAGQPEQGMPDWRSDLATNPRAMTDEEITDTVAWLAAHRIGAPGQPYGQPAQAAEPAVGQRKGGQHE
jgi:mono/diheme cytochrome c family protein